MMMNTVLMRWPLPGWVVLVVDPALTVVVVVHPESVQAPQQLSVRPTHADPPRGAPHLVASCLIVQRVSPSELVRQHVTASPLPHTLRAAQRRTMGAQFLLSSPASTLSRIMRAAQREYS